MKGFNVLALDKNYQIISLIWHTNLQWNRKYHEAGTFSIQIPYGQYRQDMRYIYTKDRPELGKITQVNYQAKLSMVVAQFIKAKIRFILNIIIITYQCIIV